MKRCHLFALLTVPLLFIGCRSTMTLHSVRDVGSIPVLEITGIIDRQGVNQIAAALDRIEKGSPTAVIVVIDIDGGEVNALLTLGDRIDDIEVPTYGLVRKSTGGGATVLFAAVNTVYVMPDARVGTIDLVHPSMVGLQMPAEIQAKADAAEARFKRQVTALASGNGHDPRFLLCMIDREEELVIGDHVVSPRGKFLLLSAQAAVDLALAKGIVDSPDALAAIILGR